MIQGRISGAAPSSIPVNVGVFLKRYTRSRGRCPACNAVMDDLGCRVLRVTRITSRPQIAPATEQRALRELLRTYPVAFEVACCSPVFAAERRAWRLASGLSPEPVGS